jgi:hypothetical protein
MSKKTFHRWAVATAAGLAVASAAFAATNLPASNVVSGGVTVDEFAALNRMSNEYQLKLILAAKGSGAYLADVDVVVKALPSREVVIEHRTEGPLLLASLPPGRYEVTASYGQVLPGAPHNVSRTFTVAGSGLSQMVMYFDTGDKVSGDLAADTTQR